VGQFAIQFRSGFGFADIIERESGRPLAQPVDLLVINPGLPSRARANRVDYRVDVVARVVAADIPVCRDDVSNSSARPKQRVHVQPLPEGSADLPAGAPSERPQRSSLVLLVTGREERDVMMSGATRPRPAPRRSIRCTRSRSAERRTQPARRCDFHIHTFIRATLGLFDRTLPSSSARPRAVDARMPEILIVPGPGR